eukprot:CAMPEP_0184871938 /NCGR_PEP_ID=MMETSP0580-20130426/41000_1 /TAXON_ID=1118495 /ORGANISM="Dactyliosolen fragilissimus" /LENGTH=857 /DNA_ID=CAMNT_0027374663 /DNA_START=184 /DNA_END=2757 /DNA_ORIENTATION=+
MTNAVVVVGKGGKGGKGKEVKCKIPRSTSTRKLVTARSKISSIHKAKGRVDLDSDNNPQPSVIVNGVRYNDDADEIVKALRNSSTVRKLRNAKNSRSLDSEVVYHGESGARKPRTLTVEGDYYEVQEAVVQAAAPKSTKSPDYTKSPSTKSPDYTKSPSSKTKSPSTKSPSTKSPSTKSPSTKHPSGTKSPDYTKSPSTKSPDYTKSPSSKTKSPSTKSPSTKSPSTKSPSTKHPSGTKSPDYTKSPSTKSPDYTKSPSTKSPDYTKSPSTKSPDYTKSPSTKSPDYTKSPSTKSPDYTKSPSTKSPDYTKSPSTKSPDYTKSPSTKSPAYTKSPSSKTKSPSTKSPSTKSPSTKSPITYNDDDVYDYQGVPLDERPNYNWEICDAPTPVPSTPSPTTTPTSGPTSTPTSAPTKTPFSAPTPSPTKTPTQQPVLNDLPPQPAWCKSLAEGEVYTTGLSSTVNYNYELLSSSSVGVDSAASSLDDSLGAALSSELIDCSVGSNRRLLIHPGSNLIVSIQTKSISSQKDKHRQLQIDGLDMGSPDTTTGIGCSVMSPDENQDCNRMSGDVIIYLRENSAESSISEASQQLLAAIKKVMVSGDLVDNTTGILGCVFIGGSYPGMEGDNTTPSAPAGAASATTQGEGVKSGLTGAGVGIIAAAAFVAFAVLVVVVKRKQSSKISSRDYVEEEELSIFGKDLEDKNLYPSDTPMSDDKTDVMSTVSTNVSSAWRNSRGAHVYGEDDSVVSHIPDGSSIVDDLRAAEGSRLHGISSSRRSYMGPHIDDNIGQSHIVHDVHACTSSTCELCAAQNRTAFLPSDAVLSPFAEGEETEGLVGNELAEALDKVTSGRNYASRDTVQF